MWTTCNEARGTWSHVSRGKLLGEFDYETEDCLPNCPLWHGKLTGFDLNGCTLHLLKCSVCYYYYYYYYYYYLKNRVHYNCFLSPISISCLQRSRYMISTSVSLHSIMLLWTPSIGYLPFPPFLLSLSFLSLEFCLVVLYLLLELHVYTTMDVFFFVVCKTFLSACILSLIWPLRIINFLHFPAEGLQISISNISNLWGYLLMVHVSALYNSVLCNNNRNIVLII